VIARDPDVSLRELMARIGHSSHAAAHRYQHATAERRKEIADYPGWCDHCCNWPEPSIAVRIRP
jgi:hypothetical protein